MLLYTLGIDILSKRKPKASRFTRDDNDAEYLHSSNGAATVIVNCLGFPFFACVCICRATATE